MAAELGETYRVWLGDCIPSWSLLPRNLITTLVETDIGPEQGLRVGADLPAGKLEVVPAFRAARDLLLAIDRAGLAPPSAAGELDPGFLQVAGQGAPVELMAYVAAVMGLMHLTHVRTEGIGVTTEGRTLAASLKSSDAQAGPFFAELVAVTLRTFNMAYLDELGINGYPQSHITLVLYLLEQVAREPRPAAELARMASMPTEVPAEIEGDPITAAFEARALRYLVWFDVMTQESDGRYRITDNFDRLFSFDIPSVAVDGRPN
ncbi:MAG: hypothetical protein AAFY56_01640 [Pseudomonadota bacterium]